MKLKQKNCKPCEGGTLPLADADANNLLTQIPSWTIKEGRVFKQFKFKDFKEAMLFVNKVADIAEQEGHHPDISISWNKVNIELCTHAINGLSENDFIVAAKIDEI